MHLTLREAMALVEPLKKARIVAGERGLDRIIQAVNVMEVPDILEWVHPGELLVTTMYPLRMTPRRSMPWSAPAERGMRAWRTPSGYMPGFPDSMIDAANALGFPLIELPEKVSFIDIIQPLTSEILKLQANELMESEEIHRQFIELVLSGGTYRDIAQGIAQRVGRPVTIVDRFRRVLGEGIVMGHPPVHKPFFRDEAGGDHYLNDPLPPAGLSAIEGSEAVYKTVEGSAGPVEHLVCPVLVGPMALGEIIVWGRLQEPSRPIDLIAIEHGTTVAALKMMEMRSIAEAEERFRNDILEGCSLPCPPSAACHPAVERSGQPAAAALRRRARWARPPRRHDADDGAEPREAQHRLQPAPLRALPARPATGCVLLVPGPAAGRLRSISPGETSRQPHRTGPGTPDDL
jgi:purine catabolism regulator